MANQPPVRAFSTILVLAAALAPAGYAHDFEITSIVMVLTGDGRFQADVSVDADALALGLPPNADTAQVAADMAALDEAALERAIERARTTIEALIEVRFDGREAPTQVEFPHHGTPAAAVAEIPSVLGAIARLRGRVPPNAGTVSLRAGETLKTIELKFFGAGEPAAYLLSPGEESPGYPVGGGAAPVQGVWGRYLTLGFEHILPKGIDHILFVLGLFLLSIRLRPLLLQVTAFTLAHSLSLALSMLDIVSLASRPVETLIALSIAYVAIENIATSELKAWRPFVVFMFGLLHGLGFAGVLRELGIPDDRFLPALVAFNVGVEAGQLTVIGLAFLAVGRLRGKPWYRRAVVVPASLGIAVTGLYWAWERALG